MKGIAEGYGVEHLEVIATGTVREAGTATSFSTWRATAWAWTSR